ncbi:MAG: hypothetical protein K2Q10_13470, partial [Rhodospirillales bacterium]|nr:hypothetical protein [Rhodospirillales bacterium]
PNRRAQWDASIAEALKLAGDRFGDRAWGMGNYQAANVALAAATDYAGGFGGGAWQSWIEAQDETIKARARAVLTQYDQADRIRFAAGGLVPDLPGISRPGEDSVPALLMPGERVFSVPHSRIIERLASNDNADALLAEMRALREELRQLKITTARGAVLVKDEIAKGNAESADSRSAQQRAQAR